MSSKRKKSQRRFLMKITVTIANISTLTLNKVSLRHLRRTNFYLNFITLQNSFLFLSTWSLQFRVTIGKTDSTIVQFANVVIVEYLNPDFHFLYYLFFFTSDFVIMYNKPGHTVHQVQSLNLETKKLIYFKNMM